MLVFGNNLARRENSGPLILLDTTYQTQVVPAKNHTHYLSHPAIFGGNKQSGLGREGGFDSLR